MLGGRVAVGLRVGAVVLLRGTAALRTAPLPTVVTRRGFCSHTTVPLLAGLHVSSHRLLNRKDNADTGHVHGSGASGEGAGSTSGAERAADSDVTAVHKDYSEERHHNSNSSSNNSGGSEDGFHEEAIVVKDEKGNAVTRIRRLPLTLVEEVPLPQRILTDLELIMMAWCEEHARQYALFMTFIRAGIFILLFIILYVFYKTTVSSERVLRGVDKMPADLRIGSVVYFDVTENGTDIGRIVIGLLNEDCPLYCEYFHRRCTGSGGKGDSFRGMPLAAIVPRHCLIFGDGHEMEHDVPGFNTHYLPTEHLSNGAWRGALSAIAYGPNRESPNFAIHISSGDYRPQVFAIVIGGYNVIERMNQAGSKHGNAPKRHYVIEGCGELCTLAKSHIAPMPWKLYESVSSGYDEEKFGPRLPVEVLQHSDEVGAAAYAKLHPAAAAAATSAGAGGDGGVEGGFDGSAAAVAVEGEKKKKKKWLFF